MNKRQRRNDRQDAEDKALREAEDAYMEEVWQAYHKEHPNVTFDEWLKM